MFMSSSAEIGTSVFPVGENTQGWVVSIGTRLFLTREEAHEVWAGLESVLKRLEEGERSMMEPPNPGDADYCTACAGGVHSALPGQVCRCCGVTVVSREGV